MSMQMGTHDPREEGSVHITPPPGFDPMVTLDMPQGGQVPAKLNRTDGWAFDEDRDSTMAAKLRALVDEMDAKVKHWVKSSSAGMEEAEEICDLWVEIRKITQGRDITEGDEK